MNATLTSKQNDALILIERVLAGVAVDYANGEGIHKYAGFYDVAKDDYWEQITDHYEQWAIDEIQNALGYLPDGLMFNWDPRGHQLKIAIENADGYQHDWGGYGLLAPDAYDEKYGGSI